MEAFGLLRVWMRRQDKGWLRPSDVKVPNDFEDAASAIKQAPDENICLVDSWAGCEGSLSAPCIPVPHGAVQRACCKNASRSFSSGPCLSCNSVSTRGPATSSPCDAATSGEDSVQGCGPSALLYFTVSCQALYDYALNAAWIHPWFF